jgi:hypothetical protein
MSIRIIIGSQAFVRVLLLDLLGRQLVAHAWISLCKDGTVPDSDLAMIQEMGSCLVASFARRCPNR